MPLSTSSGQNNVLTPGTIFQDNYEILEILGAGGMGTVFKARQIGGINRIVALKLIINSTLGSAQSEQRFFREAKALAQLQHKNIVSFYHYGIATNGSPYTVMEFLEGESLANVINTASHFTAERSCKIMKQICSALALAHKLGIIHRDLKPDNIILLNTPEADFVKVLDFGLATQNEASSSDGNQLTKTGMVVGSPDYMSPEQARGERADALSDIYACGCILYEMITGEKVFEADNSIALLSKHCNEIPKNFAERKFGKDCPAAMEAVCRKCLEKDKSKRYQSMEELGHDLEAIEKGQEESISAQLPRKQTDITKNAVIVFCLSVLILGAVVIGFYKLKPAPESAEQKLHSISTHLKQLLNTDNDIEIKRLYNESLRSHEYFKLPFEKKQELLASYLDTFSKRGKKQLAFDAACQIIDMEIKSLRNPAKSQDENIKRINSSNMSYCDAACDYLMAQDLTEQQWKSLDRIFEKQNFYITSKLYKLIALRAKTHDEYKVGEAERADKTAADYHALLIQDAERGDIKAVQKSFKEIAELQKKYNASPIRLYIAYVTRGQLWLKQNNLKNAKADLESARALQAESCPSGDELGQFNLLKSSFEKATKSTSKE